jgi:hypothetical protein
VIANYSAGASRGRVRLELPDAAAERLVLRDELGGRTELRAAAGLREAGLPVDLGPWGRLVLDLSPAGEE